jgi:uncharacterized protein
VKTLVVIAVICLIAYAVWYKWRKLPPQTKQLLGAMVGMAGAYRQMKKQQNSGGSASTYEASRGSGHLMIGCEQCGLHVPENEGVRAKGRFYCCTEHVR